MKPSFTLTACLLSLGALASVRAQEVKFAIPNAQSTPPAETPAKEASAPAAPAAAAPAAPVTPAFTEAQLVEEFGWFVGKRIGLSELEFSSQEVDALVKGLRQAAAGKEAPYDLQKVGPEMDAFMQRKQGQYMGKLKDQNLQQATAFFTKLKENKNVIELPDGLRYEIVQPGQGAYPKASDTVKVNYTGKLIDGTVFDSSLQPRQPGGTPEPAEFKLDEVIPGWTEGIQKINKGGKIRLYVPPQLAYGDEGRPGIPPGSVLIFDVDLLDINPPAAANTTPPPAEQKK